MKRPKQTATPDPSGRVRRLNFRVTEAEYQAVAERAAKRGMKPSTYARERFLSDAR